MKSAAAAPAATSIPHYDSMADFYRRVYACELPGDLECTVHRIERIHGQAPFRSPLFRTNYYSLVLIRTGGGRYFRDAETYETRARTFYLTNPGHIKGFEIARPTTGWVITFSEAFLKTRVQAEVFAEFPFLLYDSAPPQFPSRESFEKLDTLCDRLDALLIDPSRYRERLVGSQLLMLLLRIKDLYGGHYARLNDAGAGQRLVRAFQRQVEMQMQALSRGVAGRFPQVAEMAQALQVHPGYLSTVVSTFSGKTPKRWIDEKLAYAAQSLLARSDLTVAEIAARLGFGEAAHFTRFYKRQTGKTPSGFRQDALAQAG